jgi:hypothetical protein
MRHPHMGGARVLDRGGLVQASIDFQNLLIPVASSHDFCKESLLPISLGYSWMIIHNSLKRYRGLIRRYSIPFGKERCGKSLGSKCDPKS